jgi:hypothetical protein
MKKWILTLIMIVCITAVYAQPFTVTNKFTLTSTVQVIHTIDFGNMIPVVSSAGSPLTNSSRWGTWIPRYIDAVIYTNGLTTNNVTDIRVEWTARTSKATFQERDIHQGVPDLWNGVHYIRLPLAKERILTGQRLNVWILFQDQNTTLTNLAQTTNVVYSSAGLIKKIIEIPPNKPAWLP